MFNSPYKSQPTYFIYCVGQCPERIARFRAAMNVVLSRFSSGLFRAMFAMKEIKNGNEIHRRVSA